MNSLISVGTLVLIFIYKIDCKLRTINSHSDDMKFGCTGVICPDNIFYDLVSKSQAAQTALRCSECYDKLFNTCLWNNHSLTTQNTYAVCLHSVPEDCTLTSISKELKDDHGYSVCFKPGVELLPLPNLEVDSADENTLILRVPNLKADAYWRTLLNHIAQVQIFIEYPPAEKCEGGELHIPESSGGSERSCSTVVKSMNRNEFMVTQDFVNRYRTEVYRSELPIEKDFENPSRPFAFFGLRILFNRKRQLIVEREEFQLINKEAVASTIMDSNSPDFDVTLQSFNYEPHQNVGSSEKTGPNTRTTVLAILLSLLVVMLFILVLYGFWRRKSGKSLNCCSHAIGNPISYSYVAVKNELNAGGETKLDDLHNDQTEALLDDKTAELVEYYDLLAECPMFTLPQLDVQEVIGQGSFAPGNPIKKGHFYHTKLDAMVLNITTPCLQSKDEICDFLPAFRDSVKLSKHPNIISLLAVCDQEDRLLACVELPKGDNLQKSLRDSRTLGNLDASLNEFAVKHKMASLLNAQRLFQLMIGVARGVAHLEECKVIHSNLAAIHICLVDGTPKISGFGLATASQLYSRENERSHDCLRWSAPELLSSPASWPSTRSQVYSLCTILWEIASLGATPYWNIQNSEICNLVCNMQTTPEPISYISAKLYDTLKLGWIKSSVQRPTASDMLQKILTLSETPKEHIDLRLNSNCQFDYIPFDIKKEQILDLSLSFT